MRNIVESTCLTCHICLRPFVSRNSRLPYWGLLTHLYLNVFAFVVVLEFTHAPAIELYSLLTSIICVFMILYFIPEFVVVFEFTCVCPYKSNFQITLPFSPAQAHRGTLCGLLCDQFSSQPHPLFPILTE